MAHPRPILALIPALMLAAAPAVAQPVIIPLEKQADTDQKPVASAPPVAPPTAPPSLPPTGIARGTDANDQEQAAQPEPAKPKE